MSFPSSSSGYPSVEGPAGGQPLPVDVAGAASAAMPQDTNALAAEAIKKIVAARSLPEGGGLVPGPTMMQPRLPQPPMHMDGGSAIAQGPFASVGARKRADTAALFNNISNVVNTAKDRIYQKKVETIKQDFDTLQQAIQGFNEGKSSGNQEMMKHNAKIINDIVMDPKKNKELSQAFDVNMNPMAEGKKKDQKPDPAKDAMKKSYAEAQQKFQKGETPLSPQAQMLMNRMPQTLQPDPRLAAQAWMVKNKLAPTADKQLEVYGRVMDAAIRGQAQLDSAGINKIAALSLRSGLLAAERLRVAGKLDTETLRHTNKMLEIMKQHELATKEIDPKKQADMLEKLNKTADDTIGSVTLNPDGSVKSATGIQGQIQRNNDAIKEILKDMPGSASGYTPDQINALANADPNSFLNIFKKGDIEKAKQIQAKMQDNEVLQNEMKSLTITKMGIGKVIRDVGARGIYGGGSANTTDNSTDNDGDGSGDSEDGQDDGGASGAVDLLERSFGSQQPQ